MKNLLSTIKPYLNDKRVLGAYVGTLALVGSIVVMGNQAATPSGKRPGALAASIGPGDAPSQVTESAVASLAPSAAPSAGKKGSGSRPGVGVPVPTKGIRPPGVHYDTQTVEIYHYWSDSSSSPFVPSGTPHDSFDDGKAFDALVKFINKHAEDGTDFMGTKLNLGKWRLVGTNRQTDSKDPRAIDSVTRDIVETELPFVAMTVRGSMAVQNCPEIAAHGIHVLASNLPYADDIAKETNGYCIPMALSWAQQKSATINYVKWHKDTPFTSVNRPGAGEAPCPNGCPRVYGFVYSEYGSSNIDNQDTKFYTLADQAAKVVAKLRAEGVNIPDGAVQSLPAGLTNASQYTGGVIAKLIAAGVNTVIMPDAGTSLALTASAAAAQWQPDYYVWPCSGQDTTGYSRLLPASQWNNASGLSCYHPSMDADLTLDSDDKNTQWYRAFQEIYPGSETPSSTYLVYQGLQPIVAAISKLGTRDFTVENFRAALREVQPYRYSGYTGRTSSDADLLMEMGNGVDNSIWGDLARVTYASAPSNPYHYIDPRRYKSNQSFP